MAAKADARVAPLVAHWPHKKALGSPNAQPLHRKALLAYIIPQSLTSKKTSNGVGLVIKDEGRVATTLASGVTSLGIK